MPRRERKNHVIAWLCRYVADGRLLASAPICNPRDTPEFRDMAMTFEQDKQLAQLEDSFTLIVSQLRDIQRYMHAKFEEHDKALRRHRRAIDQARR